jgi:CheY-like chemotaxis protein
VFPSQIYRILVVDDVADNLFLLQTLLEVEGYKVDTANNGTQALAQIAAAPPDLVLLDVMMPDINGYVVAQRLRQNKQLPFIPIVLVTAQDKPSASEELDSGDLDRIYKPFDVDELLAKILALLQLKHSTNALSFGSHPWQSLDES